MDGQIYPILAKPMFPPNMLKIPDVGQIVKVFVIANDRDDDLEDDMGLVDFPDFIYYDHRIIDTQTNGQLPADFKKNYPKRCGMWLADGSLFYFDETKNQKEFILKLTDGNNFFQITESKIVIDQNGTKIELENGTMTTTVNTSKFGASSANVPIMLGTAGTDMNTYITSLNAAITAYLAGSPPYAAPPVDPNHALFLGAWKALLTTLGAATGNWPSTKHFVDQ